MESPSEAGGEEPAAVTLQIRLFGAFTLIQEGTHLRGTRTQKGRWLLALLLLRKGQAVDRAWLAGTLWPDSTDTQAKENLRTSLKDLRRILGPERARLISPTKLTLTFSTVRAECDLFLFDAALARGDIASLERAITLYRGELLEGCNAEWVYPERQARQQSYLSTLEALAESALSTQAPERAVHYLRRLVASDPLRDSAWQRLMRAFAATGDYAAITETYRELRQLFRERLNIAPPEEITRLYYELREQRYSDDNNPYKAPSRMPLITSLPRPLTPLIGRITEIETVCDLLTKARLVTLTGIGGVGKTRLATAVAERLHSAFPAGIFFVPLMDILESERLVEAVRDGLDLPRAPNADPFVQVIDKLSTGSCLLLLDNFEHLVERGTAFVQKLLQQIPLLTILVTSRQALHLRGEQEFIVPTLSVPESGRQSVDHIIGSEGVQLFLVGAKARRPNFEVSSGNASAIAGLCRKLDGLPLAIELAAAWVHLLTPSQILARLTGERFALLVSTHKDQPERHRTMRAAIDWSFHLLEIPVRQFAAKLSIFRGGWTMDAAQAICNEPNALQYLQQLYDVSLLQVEERNDSMRYRYLETIREYSAEQVTGHGRQELASNHLAFFLGLAEEAAPYLTGPEQASWLDRLETEHDNLRAALEWCSLKEAESIQAGFQLACSLRRFWEMRAYFAEGEEHLRRLLRCTGSEMKTASRARALYAAGVLAARQEEFIRTQRFMEEALSIFRELGDKEGMAASLNNLSSAARYYGYLLQSYPLVEEALSLFRELGDKQGIASALVGLGCAERERGNLTSARAFLEEALQIRRELGDKWALSISLHELGLVVDRQRAYSLNVECLGICRELKDLWGVGRSLNCLGSVAGLLGNVAQARSSIEEALTIYQKLGHKAGKANSLRNLGSIARQQGDFARAQALFEEALSLFLELNHSEGIAHSLLGVGMAARRQGDFTLAFVRFKESLIRFQEMGYKLSMAAALEEIAAMFLAQGEAQKSVYLWSVAKAHRELLGGAVPPKEHQDKAEQARALLGENVFAVAWAAGQAMTLEEAARYALSYLS